MSWATSEAALADFDAAISRFKSVRLNEGEHFLIEADLQWALQNAQEDPGKFETALESARAALKAWEKEAASAPETANREDGATHRFNYAVCLTALGVVHGRRDYLDHAHDLFASVANFAAVENLASLHGKAVHNLGILCVQVMILERQLSGDGFREASDLCKIAGDSFEIANDREAHAAAKQSEGEALLWLAGITEDRQDSYRAGLVYAEAMDLFKVLARGEWSQWLARSANSAAAAFMQFAMLAAEAERKKEMLKVSVETFDIAADAFEGIGNVEELWRTRARQGSTLVHLFLKTGEFSFLDRAGALFRGAQEMFEQAGLVDDAAHAQQGVVFVARRKRQHAADLLAEKARAHLSVADIAKKEGNVAQERLAVEKASEHCFNAVRMYGEAGAIREYGEAAAAAGAVFRRSGLLSRDAAKLKLAVDASLRGAMTLEVAQNKDASVQASEEAARALDALEQLARRDLTSSVQTCQGGESATKKGTEEIIERADALPTVLFDDFATASVAQIVDALQPDVPDEAIARILELIQDAQRKPPENKAGFVAEINAALDALNLRIRVVGDGQLARLKFLKASKSGSIQLRLPGTSRGFQSVDLEVIRVTAGFRKKPADYHSP